MKPQERIYLTYKSRMTSEARLRLLARFWNFLLSWYSFLLIAVSLLDLTGRFTIPSFNVIAAIGSVAVFGLSLYIAAERHEARADDYRRCYLELQAIYADGDSVETKMPRYADVLSRYENQIESDYDDMLFDAYVRGQSLENASGPVSITGYKMASVVVRRVFRLIWMGIFVAGPVVILFRWISLAPPTHVG